jgi:hypothetical protein
MNKTKHDYVDMDFVNYILSEYTPDQLTIDIIKGAAEVGIMIDGTIVNKKTADYIAKRIRQIQGGQNGIMSDQWIAFTAKQDIKKGDFVLIDEHDNQSVTPAKEMEVSPTTLEELFEEFELKKSQSDYKVETVNANTYKAYHYGAMFNLEDVKASLDKAPQELKMIWYFEPFGHYFVGDITAMHDFPFIYKNEDPAHNDDIKNTAVIGPFHNVEEIKNYFDLIRYEDFSMSDEEIISRIGDLVVAIKYYQAKDNAAKYQSIIDNLWSALKSTLFGNI